MSINLTPDYRDIDFQTMVERLRTLLSNIESFKDYDFEGANITILMELVAYVGDLNTYFTNKLAQNIHTDTANIYEVVHSLSRQQGHEPSGYVGATLQIAIRVYMEDDEQTTLYFQENDQLMIPQWFKIDTGLTTDDGEVIYYTLTEPFVYNVTQTDVTLGYVDFVIELRQGEPLQDPLEYTGEDLVSNQIVLPFQNWDMSTYPYDESPPSIVVTVGDSEETWVRINDFFDDISGLMEEDNAYMLLYDKYERNVLAFSNTRNIPELTDPIKVYPIETLGLNGGIAKDTFSWSTSGTLGQGLTVDIVSVDGNGTVTDVTVNQSGSDYNTGSTVPVLGGSGSGLQINIDTVGATGNVQVISVSDGGSGYSVSDNNLSVTSRYIQQTGVVPDTDTVLGQDVDFITNITDTGVGKIPVTQYILANTSASSGGSNPQSIDELKVSGSSAAQSQQRNVTKRDYIGNLERRGDITVANAWGEQEENPDTLILENYNKAYISVIPAEWENEADDNVQLTSVSINNDFSRNTDKALDFPVAYNTVWTEELLEYIEPRKMLGIYEYFELPELVYFRFDFGLKVKRSYNWVTVQQAIKDKLDWYFDNSNREFGERIDFRDVTNYILDVSNVSPTNDFFAVRGIDSLVVRDIMTYRHAVRLETVDVQEACEDMGGTWSGSCDIIPDEMYIYPENTHNYFPQYYELGYVQNNTDTTYNDLQPIQLGYKQFPQIAIDLCVFTNEG